MKNLLMEWTLFNVHLMTYKEYDYNQKVWKNYRMEGMNTPTPTKIYMTDQEHDLWKDSVCEKQSKWLKDHNITLEQITKVLNSSIHDPEPYDEPGDITYPEPEDDEPETEIVEEYL